ncbi:MAG: DUF3015 domain-containing protein [Polyangiaceae bacterium]|jgi:hypothetical protein|nr:DUF3015 domain-containing protein [Polyangiaceae bacterium]
MKKTPVLMFLAAVFTSSVAMADGYGTAGCGLGSIVFGNKSGIVQIFAATTNGTSASQTFGITSGTSNCKDTGGGKASAKAFIEANREALAKEIARGKGESIKNLATIAGCGNSAAVGTHLKKNFKQIFPNQNASASDVSGSIIQTLQGNEALSCSKLAG